MKPRRALWLLNHTTLRHFEIPVLQSLGYEVFVPKSFPYDAGNLSASVVYDFDSTLSIPRHDLDQLNAANFYEQITPDIADLINRYFEIAFFGFFPVQLASLVNMFEGTLVMRPFGLPGASYTKIASESLGRFFFRKLERIEHRFWFGQAYEHLAEVEQGIFKRKAITLPLGLDDTSPHSRWTGSDSQILFICPRISTEPYYQAIYEEFRKDFAGLPYTVGGAQPIAVPDRHVVGFLARGKYDRLMQTSRVMFYQSQDSHHIHYHPFEAVRTGMPLIFMADGMLDRLGGKDLPGRARTISEARNKLERILSDDRSFIRKVTSSQVRLLEPMNPARCVSEWQVGFEAIRRSIAPVEPKTPRSERRVRIAVLVPIGYRGGSLRGAKLLARAIDIGCRDAGCDAEVIFAHLDDASCYSETDFDDLPATIKRRPYHWRIMDRDESARAMTYAGLQPSLTEPIYQTPDDGVQQFNDCDLFVVVSDRLDFPLLPIRPYVLMVYDYLQRYIKFLPEETNRNLIKRAQDAEAVLVTTDFTRLDAIQYAGVPATKVRRVPMLASMFSKAALSVNAERPEYFIWTTNLSLQKNHDNASKALRFYYEKLDGRLECLITGVDTKGILKSDMSHLSGLRTARASSLIIKRKLKALGELPDDGYQALVAQAAFLWHPGRVDNGTFSVVEAAHVGVPALSSDYPAMREVDHQFGLNLAWMDPNDPSDMGRQLKQMECQFATRREHLPTARQLEGQSVEALSGAYWNVIRDYL